MPILACLGDSVCAGEGDSHANGWVSRIRQRLNQDWVTYNLAVCGDTVAGVATRWGEVTYRTPDYMIIAVGYNDIKVSKSSGNPNYIGPLLIEDAWSFIFDRVKEMKVPTLVVLPWLGQEVVTERSLFTVKGIEDYASFLTPLLTKHHIPFVQVQGLKPTDYIDGLHPNHSGYDIMGEAIYSKIKELGWVHENR